MNRTQLEPAFVLHPRPYRESSVLLEIFSASRGRVGLVARGARSPKARWRNLFQPFHCLLLSWSERGELGTLVGAESAAPAHALTGDAVFSGWYLNELLLRTLARHDPHPELFTHYAAALEALAARPEPEILRRFEIALLEQIGYALHLPDDLEPDGWYDYHADSGPSRCGPHDGAYRGASLLDLAAGRLEGATTLKDARRLLRAALEPHLGGRPLQTPRMLRQLKQARSGADEGAHA